jgi:hypothetical protein
MLITEAIVVSILSVVMMMLVMLFVMMRIYRAARLAEPIGQLDIALLANDNNMNDDSSDKGVNGMLIEQFSVRGRRNCCRYLFEIIPDPPTHITWPNGVPHFSDYLKGKWGCVLLIIMITIATTMGGT